MNRLTMQAPTLTVRQPWASLIATGAKAYETRNWPPPAKLVGRRLAIHAGRARLPRDLTGDVIAAIEIALHIPFRDWSGLPFGAIVCTANLSGAYQVASWDASLRRATIANVVAGSEPLDGIQLRADEWRFGDQAPARWLWKFDGIQLVEPPLPAIGQQGIWNWSGPLGV